MEEHQLDPTRTFRAQGVVPKRDQWVRCPDNRRGKVVNSPKTIIDFVRVHRMDGSKRTYPQHDLYPDNASSKPPMQDELVE